ncbi:hypothetical protein [Microcystis phage Mwe-JY26]
MSEHKTTPAEVAERQAADLIAAGWKRLDGAPRDGTRIVGWSPRWECWRQVYCQGGQWCFQGGNPAAPVLWFPLPGMPYAT